MGKGGKNDDEVGCKNYGVPLYGAAWVPTAAAAALSSVGKDNAAEPEIHASISRHVVLAGGGGEGRIGIPNALLLSVFDFESISLSEEPVAKLRTGSDLPYRIAVHPGGEGLICSFPKSCKWFEWDSPTSEEKHMLNLKPSTKTFEQLEDVGQQLAMTFNSEGSLLAIGGEDGKLRVFKCPSMEITLDEISVHTSVKDLDFSPDGKFLVSVGSGSGPGRIWNVSTATSVASLPNQNEEIFGFCRFARTSDTDQVLYITSIKDNGGSITRWNTSSWRRISSTHVSREPISAFNVSPDGNLLAVGTIEGDVLILSSASMRVHSVVKKAHLGLVTALTFSPDSRVLASASIDSSARVTLVKEKKKDGKGLLWTIVLIIFIAIAAAYYYMPEPKLLLR